MFLFIFSLFLFTFFSIIEGRAVVIQTPQYQSIVLLCLFFRQFGSENQRFDLFRLRTNSQHSTSMNEHPETYLSVEILSSLSSNNPTSEDYEWVLRRIAERVTTGPFITTAGLTLPYLLNLSSTLLCPHVAPRVSHLLLEALPRICAASEIKPNETFYIVGMETVGGILVSQLAATLHLNALINSSPYLQNAKLLYMRKQAKKTGTQRLLEGSMDSAPGEQKAIWLDDVNSTGSSLVEGVKALQKENIQLKGALYVVDRGSDRRNVEENKKKCLEAQLSKLPIMALYDLRQIDDNVVDSDDPTIR